MRIAVAVATSVVVLATASQAAATAPRTLSGTFEKPVPEALVPTLGGATSLLFDLSFRPGTYTVTLAGVNLNTGTSIDTGSTVTFQEPTALDGCTTPGTYGYQLDGDGDALSFQLVNDPSLFCFARDVSLTLGPWYRVS
jgi:hypothetical protein